MAKSRRNRAGARKDPLAKPVKPPADPELAALRETKILPVIADLKSTDTKKRTAAASAISSIIQDTKCRKLLLREQVVHTVLTETITDTALESRAAGWGILQVLAQEEEADFCIHLFRSDVLTAIEYASKQVSNTPPTPAFSPPLLYWCTRQLTQPPSSSPRESSPPNPNSPSFPRPSKRPSSA